MERLNDFFKWGIKIGSRLCTKPHIKNREVSKINAARVDALFTAILGSYLLGIQIAIKIRKFLIDCVFCPSRKLNY